MGWDLRIHLGQPGWGLSPAVVRKVEPSRGCMVSICRVDGREKTTEVRDHQVRYTACVVP